MGAKLKCYDDRLEQLQKQNEDFSAIVEQLMNAIQKGKGLYERRFTEMKERHENQLKEVMNRWLNDKLDLQTRNAELEDKVKDWNNKSRDSVKLMKRMEARVTKVTSDLQLRSCELQKVKQERDLLKEVNQKLETCIKDQADNTTNYRLILEAEVDELRGKLRCSEQRNLELVKGTSSQRRVSNSSRESGDCNITECPARLRTPSDSGQEVCSFEVSNTKPPDTCSYVGKVLKCVEVPPSRPSIRNIPREILLLFLSILFFLLSLISKCSSECTYYREPYSPPPITVSTMPYLSQ